MEWDTVQRIGAVGAVCVSLYSTIVTKRELSRKVKLTDVAREREVWGLLLKLLPL